MFDGSSSKDLSNNESDTYLYPDLDMDSLPWGDENGSVAGLICDVYTTEGRTIWAGRISRGNLNVPFVIWKNLGFKSFNLGPETRILFFKLDENGDPTLGSKRQRWLFGFGSNRPCRATPVRNQNVLTKMALK